VLGGLFLAAALARPASVRGQAAELNQLTAGEKKDGWVLLFDGKSTAGWRSFKSPTPYEGWEIEDAALHLRVAPGYRGGHDLISEKDYGDFDLQWDWKLAPHANSGLKYFVSLERRTPLGHEYQMLDDDHYNHAQEGDHSSNFTGTIHGTAAFYEVLAPTNVVLHPAGEYNHSRVLVRGNHVEHWLNGNKVLEYELGSPAVKDGVARSKFKNVEGFGERATGHILLQDHGDEVWFRNIKIRPGPEKISP
jgi:hypothetical protein